MKILAFWKAAWPGEDVPERDDITNSIEDFERLYKNRDEWGVRLYDMESYRNEPDVFKLDGALKNADNFVEDYNDEFLDGGHWTYVFHIDAYYVKQVIRRNKLWQQKH